VARCVVDEAVVAVVDVEDAIDDFAVDARSELVAEAGRTLPREVRADVKRAYVRPPGEIGDTVKVSGLIEVERVT
jgi:hypothetical protein